MGRNGDLLTSSKPALRGHVTIAIAVGDGETREARLPRVMRSSPRACKTTCARQEEVCRRRGWIRDYLRADDVPAKQHRVETWLDNQTPRLDSVPSPRCGNTQRLDGVESVR